MKKLIVYSAVLAAVSLVALAQTAQASPATPLITLSQTEHITAQSPLPALESVQGQVRNINTEQAKITLRHGEIKSLRMPPMTMVYSVKDPALLSGLSIGDKVSFTLENAKTVDSLKKID